MWLKLGDKEKAKIYMSLLEQDQHKCTSIPSTVDAPSLADDDSDDDNNNNNHNSASSDGDHYLICNSFNTEQNNEGGSSDELSKTMMPVC